MRQYHDLMQREHESEQAEGRMRSEANVDTILAELRLLRQEVAELRSGPPRR